MYPFHCLLLWSNKFGPFLNRARFWSAFTYLLLLGRYPSFYIFIISNDRLRLFDVKSHFGTFNKLFLVCFFIMQGSGLYSIHSRSIDGLQCSASLVLTLYSTKVDLGYSMMGTSETNGPNGKSSIYLLSVDYDIFLNMLWREHRKRIALMENPIFMSKKYFQLTTNLVCLKFS